MVVVDAFSKFPEVVKMTNTTTHTTIAELHNIFSTHGLPEIPVSDNGAQFTSRDFAQFCSNNGILHRTSAAYKPFINDQAERVGRRLRTRLDLLIPSVEKHVEARQYSSMVNRTTKRGLRQFHAGDTVLARNYGRGGEVDTWSCH